MIDGVGIEHLGSSLQEPTGWSERPVSPSVRRTAIRFAVATLVILGAAPLMTIAAERKRESLRQRRRQHGGTPLRRLADTEGPILSVVPGAQTVAALGAILLTALAVTAIVGGTETRIRRFEPDALVLLIAYIGALAAVALVRST
jgi:hypothetical protein